MLGFKFSLLTLLVRRACLSVILESLHCCSLCRWCGLEAEDGLSEGAVIGLFMGEANGHVVKKLDHQSKGDFVDKPVGELDG